MVKNRNLLKVSTTKKRGCNFTCGLYLITPPRFKRKTETIGTTQDERAYTISPRFRRRVNTKGFKNVLLERSNCIFALLRGTNFMLKYRGIR